MKVANSQRVITGECLALLRRRQASPHLCGGITCCQLDQKLLMLCFRGTTAWVGFVDWVNYAHIGYQVAANNNVLLNKCVAIVI